ncbi:MAG: hypothetical protein FJ271_21520 [Planctomycetes bacterium]|nr:hypothetical protein [Planctomycetota bacterium]
MANGDASLGFSWQVPAEYQDLLLGPEGLRLDEWRAAGRVRIVKHVRYRTIYHVTMPGLTFYLKHYPVVDFRSWFRQMVRPSKARGEYMKAIEVTRRGVATFVPLGLGERPTLLGAEESYLISRALDETEPLSTFIEHTLPSLPAARRSALVPRLAIAIGEYIGRMHDAGILHHDLHAGNLLLRLERDDEPVLFLVDLHAVSLHSPLDWPTSQRNLVVFNRWLARSLSRTNRLRCWKAYCRVRNRAGESPAPAHLRRTLADDLERRTAASQIRFSLRRDGRCCAESRCFRRLRGPGLAGHAVADVDPWLVETLLADPEGPFGWRDSRILKTSASSTVAEIAVAGPAGPRRYIYKQIRGGTFKDALAGLFRPPPALRSWRSGHAMLDRSLPTPRPLLVLQRRRAGCSQDGFLLTEKIEDALDLKAFLARLAARPTDERQRRQRHLIDQLAGIIRDMHRWRLSHRDLKAANILVSEGGSETACRVCLIDLVGVTHGRRLPRRRRLQNLARLNASFVDNIAINQADRLRFLRTYMQWGLRGKTGWKTWWHAIAAATQAKARRNQRLGRTLG